MNNPVMTVGSCSAALMAIPQMRPKKARSLRMLMFRQEAGSQICRFDGICLLEHDLPPVFVS
ncbi:MAG: hypothetical protein P8Y63_15050 [Deltaproteobacteria bacterium]